MQRGRNFLGLFVIFVMPFFANAQIVITEIMYDPAGADSGREWIEIYNAGTSEVVLTGLRLYEGGTNHKISTQAGSDVLAPQAYAVLADNPAKFAADYPDFHGQVFDSAFSLSNQGETIVLRDGKLVDVNSATYAAVPAASGVGNSLQTLPRQAGAAQGPEDFAPHTPTPGAAMSLTMIPIPVKEAPPPKAAKSKTSKKSSSSRGVSDPADDMVVESSAGSSTASASVASAALPAGVTDTGSQYWWWIGTIALAGVASVATFASRHIAKREWEIVEEKEGE